MNLPDVTISGTRALLGSGEVTAAELCQRHLDRIADIDRDGPTLRAVSEVNPEAIADADRADRTRWSADGAMPLLGIPILVKDSIDTAGPMTTTGGSLAMLGRVARATRSGGA